MSGAEVRDQQHAQTQETHKGKHEEAKAKAKAKEKEKLEAEKARKLQSSAAAREKNLDIGAHAKNWAELETGEKRAGKSFGGGWAKQIAQGSE